MNLSVKEELQYYKLLLTILYVT